MPGQSRKILSLSALIGLLMTTVFSACSASAITGNGGNSGNTSSNSSSCSNVQLTYWNALSGPDGPAMQQLVSQFNTSHPDIKVKMSIIALTNYATKLDTAAASNTLPDVAIVNEDQIATSAFRGIIQPIDSIMPQLGYTQNDFPARAWSQDEVAGHRYGVPLFINPLTMFYNADLMKQAGINTSPTTAAQFTADAAAMTKGNVHGFQITSGFPVQQIFQQLLHQYGGSEFNADTTKATWNSPAGVKALEWMKQAQSSYSQPKLPVDADVNSFKAGNAGIIWNGIWQDSNVTGNAVGFNGQAAAVPQIGSDPATWGGMGSLTTPYHKQAPSQCVQNADATFIKYIVDNSAKLASFGDVPAYHTALYSSTVQSIPLMKSLASAVQNPVFPPSVPGISDAFTPLGNAIGAIMSGTSTNIQQTLNASANSADQILQQNRQKYGTTPKNA